MIEPQRSARARGLAVGLTVVAAVLLTARPARAELTIDHETAASGCDEAAAYFPEDESPQATRARQRCRLETFEHRLDDQQREKEVQAEDNRDKLVQSWLDKQEVPVRVFRRYSIDGYLGGGVTTYGLAASGVLLPWLELELSIGRRDLNGLINSGASYFQDSRTCFGGRFKWLMRSRGNLTPFASLGAFDCSATVQLTTYGSGPVIGPGTTFTPPPGPSAGTAAAHLVAAGAGVTWLDRSGLHASVEYIFTYAFYTQGVLNDAMHTLDPNLAGAWTDRLATERNGFRIQVGYAF